jgi:hypothetical protein
MLKIANCALCSGETDMIVGFNHNVTYRGVCFHVQTEDSGIRTPHLITLLYHGGTIISSQKTSYADILNVDNLDAVIEDLAKEQHKGMLRRLKNGEFDQRIIDFGIGIESAAQPVVVAAQPVAVAEAKPAAAPMPSAAQPASKTKPAAVALAGAGELSEPEELDAAVIVDQTVAEPPEPESASTDLDDLIFSYLSAADGKD